MDVDAPRSEVVQRMRSVAALIEDALPRQVPHGPFLLPWETVAPALLARIAGQGRSIATLIEGGHEVDSIVVMRSMLEHVTLFAWLAITPDDAARKWKARDPPRNTEWWMVDQANREKRLAEDRGKWLGLMDDQLRAGIRQGKIILKGIDVPAGAFPRVDEMAEEIDARWGGKLVGWPDAEPHTLEFVSSARGNYWALYTHGNASTHPNYSTIRQFLRPLPYFNGAKAQVCREQTGEQVEVFAAISAFLLGAATSVADEVLGWDIHVEAMTLLGRRNQAVGPGMLTRLIIMTVGSRDGVVYGTAGDERFAVGLHDNEISMTVVRTDGSWSRLTHPTGSSQWILTDFSGNREELGPRDDARFGDEIGKHLDLLATADQVAMTHARPSDWPTAL